MMGMDDYSYKIAPVILKKFMEKKCWASLIDVNYLLSP